MQATRWANNSIINSKGVIRKRAGSLSAEKLAQAQLQLFPEDLSPTSSPNSYHLKNLLSPESLPSTEATLQHYGSNYCSAHNRFRTDSKFSDMDISDRTNSKASPVNCKVPYNNYNNGMEAYAAAPNRSKGGKNSQINNALDLDIMMPPEAKKLCNELEQLTSQERKLAMIVDEDTFSDKIQQEIDCVGCVSSLHTYRDQLAELARSKPSGVLYFEGFVIYGDKRIGFSEEKIGDIQNIAYILHHHKSKNNIIDELTRSLNIKKKHDGHLHRGKVLSRCLLHSKKPMPNGIWREALQNLIEHDINEVASVAELDESVFINSLQMHTKRRKFCSTCRENIKFVYENMLEEASNCSDCEELVEEGEEDEEEEEEEDDENEEEYEDIGEDTQIESLEINAKLGRVKINGIPYPPKAASQCVNGSDVGSMNDIPEPRDSKESERSDDHSKIISYSRKSPGNLLSCIKYCPERQKLAIPLEMEIFMEFLSKAESGTTMHTKHANTKEAAQEELIACIGTCLKERLQMIWRAKKSDELAKILFMKLAADCVVSGITLSLDDKKFRLGHKTALEEYLRETEAAEQSKKDKLRQKRQKRKEKKRNRNAPQGGTGEDSKADQDDMIEDDDGDKEQVEEVKFEIHDKEKENKNKDLNHKEAKLDKNKATNSIKEHEKAPPKVLEQALKKVEPLQSKEEINLNEDDNKKKKKNKKGKNLAASPPVFEKASTDSDTPETKKAHEKILVSAKVEKVLEEEKLEKVKINTINEVKGNKKNNKASANDERERNLLLAMGWSDETADENVAEDREIRNMKDNWNEIEESRANFRKNAMEKFKKLMHSNSNVGS